MMMILKEKNNKSDTTGVTLFILKIFSVNKKKIIVAMRQRPCRKERVTKNIKIKKMGNFIF